ncbi:hypothetical protein RRG08_056518 [Elysia crispata]|uniref:Uncharacterized protein n=1 Tax=Elysia crispata TaxID=231223 RepID=A0AAE0Z8I9_9GAST|nr:hypothetical protein RRG08_056518 [Elysia crispata]
MCLQVWRTPITEGLLGQAQKKAEKSPAANDSLEKMIGRIQSRRSSENFGNLQKIFEKMENDESNIYIFLAKKTKQLSRETQEWMEDEVVMRVYMEARQKDRAQERRQERKWHPTQLTLAIIDMPCPLQ